jgi:hypothetical protein
MNQGEFMVRVTFTPQCAEKPHGIDEPRNQEALADFDAG